MEYERTGDQVEEREQQGDSQRVVAWLFVVLVVLPKVVLFLFLAFLKYLLGREIIMFYFFPQGS